MNKYKLQRCDDQESILMMHKIREKVLFSNIKYNRFHPDDTNEKNHCFIFLVNEIPVGTVRLDFINSNKAAVRLFAILSEFQRQKIGTHMMTALEEYALNNGIEMLNTNAALDAKKFYESVGFISEKWDDPGEGSSQPTTPMVKYLKHK